MNRIVAGLGAGIVVVAGVALGAPKLSPGNRPPDFELPPLQAVPPGKEVAFGLHAIDHEGDTLTIELADKPASATYDPLTLTVRWKPTGKDAPAGRFRVKVTETAREGGQKRVFTHDFAIAVDAGAKPVAVAQPLGPEIEELVTIHDPARLEQVNKDWPITKTLDVVRTISLRELPEADKAKSTAPDAKQLFADAMAAIALRQGNPRADAKSKAFDKQQFGDPAAWKIVAVRPRLDKAVMELRIVYENVRAPEPVYLMFRFRLVRDLPPGEIDPAAVELNNKELTRLVLETFFKDGALDPRFETDKKAHGKAVSAFVTAVLTYASDKHPQLGAEFMALPHEARLGGGDARGADGAYASGDGWAWAVIKNKWVAAGDQQTLKMVSVPIPGFTTEIKASDDGTRWRTVCAQKYDPDDAKHTAGWEVLCRKKQGFTDLPVVGEGGKVTSGAVDATNLYLDYKYKDMVATVDLDDPRRDNFEENGMTCSQCHVRDFGNGDLRDKAVRSPKAGHAPAASPPEATNFFTLVPETRWNPFMLEFQDFQLCLFRDAIKKFGGADVKLACPLVAEQP